MLVERISSAQLAEMAAQGHSLSATLYLREVPRVAALLAEQPGGSDMGLAVTVAFSQGPEALPVVRISASGMLALVCQRCLGAVPWPVRFDVALTVISSDAAADDLADPFDSALLDETGSLPLRAVVEDEVLASLPLAAVHGATPAAAPCVAAGAAADGAAAPAVRAYRPFAGLAAHMAARDGGDE